MTAEQELKKFMAKYEPGIAAQGRKALGKMRKMVPNAIEMVYDNFNWLVIGFVPNERPSDAVFSILLAPDHVTLCFLQGSSLPDPGKRLQGGGKLVRNVRLEPVEVLDEPEIRELIQVAMNRARVGFDPKMKRKMVVRAVSKKQRSRRVGARTGRGRKGQRRDAEIAEDEHRKLGRLGAHSQEWLCYMGMGSLAWRVTYQQGY